MECLFFHLLLVQEKQHLLKKFQKIKIFQFQYLIQLEHQDLNEKNGKDYFFISKNNFKKLIKKKEFLEHAKVFDNYYGSSKKLVIKKLKKGKKYYF